ncbi:glycosyltransferase [Sutcliffiella deserti]|uniref:glycosyltransferase n=1 Tax=Sutcliffiella deserti TaxID=2875501 RepID=UPI001CBC2F67|nr:glycosyltransferase [Sutcliffiella deserti]
MIEVSLCMIVKDEEAVLARCLECIKDIVDEIIIVDTGSSDRTREISQSFTSKVYDFEWINDFAAARNFAFSKATKDYIFWLDADDVMEKKDQQSFLKLKATIPPEVDSVLMNYHIHFDNAGNPTFSTMRNRLVKRSCQFQWEGEVHEYLKVHGVVAQSNTVIYHKKEKSSAGRNLKIYEEKRKQGDPFSSRDRFYYANELLGNHYYEEAIKEYDIFLKEKTGWVEDHIAACIQKSICHYHLQQPIEQISALCDSFLYDVPRSEVCCRIGEVFLNQLDDPDKAIFWYTFSLNLPAPPALRGLYNEPHTRTWLPHIQLAAAYEKKNDLEKALHHTNFALEINPDNVNIQQNKAVLLSKLTKEEDTSNV